MKKILVIGGGGLKGFMYLGVLRYLYENNYLDKVNTFVGTSVGGILASLLAIGYSPEELYNFAYEFDFEKLKDSIDAFGFITGSSFGIYGDDRVKITYRSLIGKKTNPDITLKELYDTTGRKLIVTSTCISTQNCCYISYENHPNMSIYTAIRMTSCIPLLFKPVLYEGLYYVDGGCMDIYPIHMFKDNIDDVIGICFIQSNELNKSIEMVDFSSFIISLLKCMSDTRNTIKGYEDYTIIVKTESMFIANFSLSKDDKNKMYLEGIKQCNEFILKNKGKNGLDNKPNIKNKKTITIKVKRKIKRKVKKSF